MRIALRFAYDARHGAYARRPQLDSVEDHLIAALRDEGYEEGSWRTGSRTDAGVAAAENVASAVVHRPLTGLVPAVQARLPDGIWMRGAAPVDEDWNPRHATSRTYAYLAPDGGEGLARMQDASAAFVGRHDMSAFARVEEGRKPVRAITACTVEAVDGGWQITVTGPNFLWNQVRRMVAAILAVGRVEAEATDIQAALAGAPVHPRFGLAPADGLLLVRVAYPGLGWDPAAGALTARRLRAPWQRAAVGRRLAAALQASG